MPIVCLQQVEKCPFDGAPRRTRTADLLFTKQLLYQLSYWGTLEQHLNGQQVSCKIETEPDCPKPTLSGYATLFPALWLFFAHFILDYIGVNDHRCLGLSLALLFGCFHLRGGGDDQRQHIGTARQGNLALGRLFPA